MERPGDDLSFFDFIGERHPFFPRIAALREALGGSPRYSSLCGFAAQGGGEVHAEIKAEWSAGTGWRLDRFYWCFQYEVDDAAVPFRAHTLYFRAGNGGPELYDFPRDPYLTAMEGWFTPLDAGANHAARVEVLRYVPLRRLTFRVLTPGHAPLIGKFKRRSKLAESYARLGAVHRAVEAGRAPFRVAAPGLMDEEACVFYQEALPGRSLVSLLSVDNVDSLFARVGELHAGLHRLPVEGLAAAEAAGAVEDNARWIAFLRPELQAELEALAALLAATRPAPRADAFLHGDFVPSQILVDRERWAVTDFDLAHRGDAAAETAAFLASLKYDVPLLADAFERGGPEAKGLLARAEESYLAGYAARAEEDPDPRRLAWHRAAAELYYLALMFKKDRYRPARFERALALIRRLARELRGQGQ